MSSAPRPALIALFTYLALAACLSGRLPFVKWTMFRFYMPTRPTVMPLFLADGIRTRTEDYTDFAGLPSSVVDTAHKGYESGVEHRFLELAHWLDEHQAPPGTSAGPTEIQIGLTILRFDQDGRVIIDTRIDATGSARRLGP